MIYWQGSFGSTTFGPPKINIEPENGELEDFPFCRGVFSGSMLIFRDVLLMQLFPGSFWVSTRPGGVIMAPCLVTVRWVVPLRPAQLLPCPWQKSTFVPSRWMRRLKLVEIRYIYIYQIEPSTYSESPETCVNIGFNLGWPGCKRASAVFFQGAKSGSMAPTCTESAPRSWDDRDPLLGQVGGHRLLFLFLGGFSVKESMPYALWLFDMQFVGKDPFCKVA